MPFGRPRLKTPRDRPYVDIPPLKRRRITYEAEDEEDEEPRLLLTQHGEDHGVGLRVRNRARFDDAEGSGSERDEEDEDGDFRDEDSEEDADEGEDDLNLDNDLGDVDLEDELRDLEADNAQIQEGEVVEPEVLDQEVLPDGTTELDLNTLDKISALRVAFPTVPADACERALSRHGGSAESAYARLQARHQPRISLDALLNYANPSAPKTTAAEDDAADESEAESVASIIKHYDQHGFPSGSILAGTAAAQMAETMRKSGHAVKPPVHTKFDDDANSHAGREPLDPVEGENSDSDEDYDSKSDGDSDSDSNSESSDDSDGDSGPEVVSSKIPNASGGARLADIRESPVSDGHDSDASERGSRTKSDSSSEAETSDSDSGDSDDSSSSDGGDDGNGANDSTDEHSEGESNVPSSDDSSDSSSSESEEADSSDDDSDDNSVDLTSRSFSSQKKTSTLVQPTRAQDDSAQGQQPQVVRPKTSSGSLEARTPVPPGQGKSATQKRNARRRAARIAQNAAARGECPTPTGGMPPVPAAEPEDLVASIAAKKAALLQSLNMVQETPLEKAKDAVISNSGNSSIPSPAPVAENSVLDGSSGETQQPVGGGHAEPSLDEAGPHESSEAWRNKIVYRAVECCQDGVELSEPPFPFVQRWDPQQQYFLGAKNQRGGRSKRKQRNQEDFLDASSRPGAKRRKYGGDSLGYDADDDYGESYISHDGTTACEETILNYDDEIPETHEQPGETPRQNVDENDEDDEDDLPSLPSDISTLPPLHPGEAMIGMILTWKQWLLSKATNWQPQVSALAGIVVEVIDNNALTVRLAKRDRNIDHSEKVYDDDGNRVYDKFELPGMDDEDEEDEEGTVQGYRTLDMADMIEPRILQPALEASGPASSAHQLSDSVHKDVSNPAVQHQEPSPLKDGRVSDAADEQQTDAHDDGGQGTVSETPVADEPVDPSISEDRRQEISLLINAAGFRKDIDPSVADITRAVVRDDASSDLGSPSRQLEEMTHDATIVPSELSEPQAHNSPRLPSQMISDNIDSQPILLEPFHGFSDPMSESHDGRDVAYPTLQLPPSETGSLHSGRQVNPDFSIELGTDSLHDLVDPAAVSRSTLGRHSDDEPELPTEGLERDSGADSESDTSDSSSLSLSDLWASGSTARSKSPSRNAVVSAINARKPDVARDLEYEEAMRRLDNSDDRSEDGTKEQLSKRARELLDKPIKRPTARKPVQTKQAPKPSSTPHVKTERATPSPAPAARRTARASSSPFAVPEGSQVVSLLTSSPEPELEEHYAEDSIDETYNEPSMNMSTGSGWVKKQRARRGVNVPAPSAGRDVVAKSLASSQSKQSADKRPTAALNALLRAKKKVLADMF